MRDAAPPLTIAPLLAAALLSLGGVPARSQTAAELQGYQRRMEQLFQRLDRNGNQRLERQEVQGHTYLERHFERLDRQQRGYLTPADLRPAGSGAAGRGAQVFERADRNGDGRIDRREAEPYPGLQRHFNAADRNGDGTVDRSELRGLAEQRRRQQTPPAP